MQKVAANPDRQDHPNRVLILGFSNVAIPSGPAVALQKRLESSGGFRVYLCGLGGLNPLIVPSAFESMRRRHGDFTHVILEISTSIYPQQTRDTESEARDLCRDILHTVVASGSRVALVHLYRRYDAPLVFDWNGMLDEAAAAAGAPVVDLADGLVRSRGRDFAEQLLRDAVHPTPAGTEFLTEAILSALAPWLGETGSTVAAPPPAVQRRLLSLTSFAPQAGEVTQQDYGFPFVRISEGESLVADFGRPMQLSALAFGYGLWGGHISVSLDGQPPFTITALDEFSKFERLGLRMFSSAAGRSVRRIELAQSSVIPDVALRSGEITKGPREGRLVGVMTIEPYSRHPRPGPLGPC